MKKHFYYILVIAGICLNGGSAMAQSEGSDSRSALVPKETSISVYPIPTSGQLHISFSRNVTVTPEVQLYDMIGNPVEEVSIEREGPNSFVINLAGKRAGFYFIKVSAGDQSFSRRITVSS